MIGGGRCQRRKKTMAGGRGAAAPAKIESNCDIPNLKQEITQKPLGFLEITKLPPTPTVELDLFTQARKALSIRSPFDSDEPAASVSSLPSGVTHLLNRLSDSRKRHKKVQSGPEKKSSAPVKARGSNFWDETEEYFRELTIKDVESLDRFSCSGFSCKDKRLSIPCLTGDDHLRAYYDTFNKMLASACDKDRISLEKGVELKSNGELQSNEGMSQEENGTRSMDVDGDEVVTTEIQMKEECNGGKIQNRGVEWLLGSRSKIYLASERPSKKRKLLGKDAGLEKLLVARPVEGLESVCHYCSYGVTGDPLNLLIKCSSCEMVVHQRCYGVQDDVDSSWVCTWCKWKNSVDSKIEMPCMFCPKKDGALKPVETRGCGRDNEGSKVEFAHLFCCQWMPEVYLENMRTMEPIMNMDELKNTRRKSICYLCKVKHGACVSCSNGSCRISFHPICAREARNRMEIWGKLGSDEVELRAFCTKHSETQCSNDTQTTGDISLTADFEFSKLNDIVLDGEELLDNRQNTECIPENGDSLHPAAKYLVQSNGNEDVNACSLLKFSMILKKLIDLGKVSAKEVASEIGVSPDSLDTILTDNHMVPELQCKLVRLLKNHAYIDSLQKTMNVKSISLVAPKVVADAADGVDAVPVEESNFSDSIPVKSVPPRRRAKSSIRTVKDEKSCSLKDKSNDETTEGDVESCVLVREDSNDPSSVSLPR